MCWRRARDRTEYRNTQRVFIFLCLLTRIEMIEAWIRYTVYLRALTWHMIVAALPSVWLMASSWQILWTKTKRCVDGLGFTLPTGVIHSHVYNLYWVTLFGCVNAIEIATFYPVRQASWPHCFNYCIFIEKRFCNENKFVICTNLDQTCDLQMCHWVLRLPF